jgi:MFS family permease
VVVTLHDSATDVGLAGAARWAPYAIAGLVAGALVDRWRRRPTLLATDVARGILLGAVPAFALAGNPNEMGGRQAVTPDRLQGARTASCAR